VTTTTEQDTIIMSIDTSINTLGTIRADGSIGANRFRRTQSTPEVEDFGVAAASTLSGSALLEATRNALAVDHGLVDCDECGNQIHININGVAHHLDDDEGIDHEADADHVGRNHDFEFEADAPGIPATNGRGPSFDDKYTAVPASADGDLTFQTYEAALAAAGGDERRVWTLVDGEYEEGNKIWKFNYDGDEMIVGGADEEEATQQAMSNLNENYDVDDDDEDNPPVSEDVLDLEGVYFGDPDDIFDEDVWEPAQSSFAEAGLRRVNGFGFAVSEEPWADESEGLPWA
jgi:hypothetical protein